MGVKGRRWIATRAREAYWVAKRAEAGRLQAILEAERRKPLDITLKETLGKILSDGKPEMVETALLVALAALSYEKFAEVKYIEYKEGYWEWDIPIKEGEALPSTVDHIGMHWVPAIKAHDEKIYHAEDALIGPIGYMLSVKTDGVASQIAGLTVLTILGLISMGIDLGIHPTTEPKEILRRAGAAHIHAMGLGTP